MSDLVFRLKKRAEIRRQISTRKSIQEGKPDRIADLLEEAAAEIERLQEENALIREHREEDGRAHQASRRRRPCAPSIVQGSRPHLHRGLLVSWRGCQNYEVGTTIYESQVARRSFWAACIYWFKTGRWERTYMTTRRFICTATGFKEEACRLPPEGWWCSRGAGHGGPCAARRTT
jgi:hypothetical protein